VIRLTRRGAVTSLSDTGLERLRSEFDLRHCARLPGLLDPDLLMLLRRTLRSADFYERRHGHIAVESCLSYETAGWRLLDFVANDARLIAAIGSITRSADLQCFTGRVYRMEPYGGHFDSWHSDTHEQRRIGMSINLGEAPYAGGLFQLRDARSKQMLAELSNTTPGDAILFRIAEGLEHSVTRVEGLAPKIAFAGWFRAVPDALTACTSIGRPQ